MENVKEKSIKANEVEKRLNVYGCHPSKVIKSKGTYKVMNARIGVTEEQAEKMLTGSMFGWDVPGSKF